MIWKNLAVVGVAEGISSWVGLVIGAPIVQNERGERFVVRDMSSDTPAPNLVLWDDEFRDNVEQNVFVQLARPWPAQQDHLVLLLSPRLVHLAHEAYGAPASFHQETLTSGWRAFHVGRSALQAFRRGASKALIERSIPALQLATQTLDPVTSPALEEQLLAVQDLAPRGSPEEREGALLWMLCKRDDEMAFSHAKRAAHMITSLSEHDLQRCLGDVMERRKIDPAISPRSGLAARNRVRRPYLSCNGVPQ